MPGQFSDPAFEEVTEGSLLSNGCSPEVEDPEFRGLVLAAPESVRYTPGRSNPLTGAFAPVIVCGTYVLAYGALGLDGDFVDAMVFVAVDDDRRETFSGRITGVENEIPAPSVFDTSDLTPADFAADVVTGYFNPNLATILSLPERPADYVVYAVLGPYESNRVTISVREDTGETP